MKLFSTENKYAMVGMLLAFGYSTEAFSQNSVTIYGIVDAGVSYTSNEGGSHNWEFANGGIAPNRFGLRITEDLGGGWRAISVLENGFTISNGVLGQGGRLFGRQAYVGLESDTYGTVTFGRQYDSMVDYAAKVAAAQNWSGAFAHPGDVDNASNTFRINNSVKYTSPSLSGITFGGLYSFGGVAGQFKTDSAVSAGVKYANGPVYLAASFMEIHNPAQAVSDGLWTVRSGTTVTNPFLAPYTTGTTANPSKLDTWGVGGSYSVSGLKVGALWTHTLFSNINAGHSLKYDNYELNAGYLFTPAFLAGVVYNFENGTYSGSNDSPRYHQAGLFTVYSLSKRTSVYALGVYQRAAGSATQTKDYLASATSSGVNQLMIRVGMLAKF